MNLNCVTSNHEDVQMMERMKKEVRFGTMTIGEDDSPRSLKERRNISFHGYITVDWLLLLWMMNE